MNNPDVVGYLAALLVFATFWMKTMGSVQNLSHI
jgi:hypothetical protein